MHVCVFVCILRNGGASKCVFFFSQVLSEWKQLAISQRSTDRNGNVQYANISMSIHCISYIFTYLSRTEDNHNCQTFQEAYRISSEIKIFSHQFLFIPRREALVSRPPPPVPADSTPPHSIHQFFG